MRAAGRCGEEEKARACGSIELFHISEFSKKSRCKNSILSKTCRALGLFLASVAHIQLTSSTSGGGQDAGKVGRRPYKDVSKEYSNN